MRTDLPEVTTDPDSFPPPLAPGCYVELSPKGAVSDPVTAFGAKVLIGFYEASIDEVECGEASTHCHREATTRIEWIDGTQSVACDEHAAEARRVWQRLIARLSTWVAEVSGA